MIDATTLEYAYPPAIVLPIGGENRPMLKWKISDAASVDPVTSGIAGFEEHFAKLTSLTSEPSHWVDGAEPPSFDALAWAQLILQELQKSDLRPTKVVASAEGGAAICFVDGDNYADLECLNSGEILGVISDRHTRPIAWEVKPTSGEIAYSISRIKAFLAASAASKDVAERQGSRSWFSLLSLPVLQTNG